MIETLEITAVGVVTFEGTFDPFEGTFDLRVAAGAGTLTLVKQVVIDNELLLGALFCKEPFLDPLLKFLSVLKPIRPRLAVWTEE